MPPWWQTSVIYQIYPRSFADSNGDGVGDLEGIRRRLEHLEWLGIDAVWLSPIYRSPMADGGYDISDHCDVDPVFGDLAAFDRLLADTHHRGMRGLLDWVPNHTSDLHPWFIESRASRHSAKRNWYLWRDGRAGGPPNNWLATFGGLAWTWDARTGQWYLHLFLPEQPDLNWSDAEVEGAMHDVLRFWLDRGVDGFRADVVHLIGKDEALPDQPEELARCLVGVHDDPSTHELLRRIRKVLDSYPGERAIVGEVNLGSASLLAPYYGAGDELHMVFNFSLLRCAWRAEWWAELVLASEKAFGAVGAWPVWVLSNHDVPRHRTRYGGSEARARVAAVVLLTLRGTPFLYAGEELGLEDAAVTAADQIDPGGRDGCRAPIPWAPGPDTAGRGELRGCHGRPSRRRETSRSSGLIQRRSFISTGGCWRPGVPRRRCMPASGGSWTVPATSWPTNGDGSTTTAGWRRTSAMGPPATSAGAATGSSRWQPPAGARGCPSTDGSPDPKRWCCGPADLTEP